MRRFRPLRTLPALQGTLLAISAYLFVAMLVAFTFIVAIRLNFHMPSGEIGITH